MKRELEIAVISDVHLGTYGCHARELNTYLNSINPKHLIVNGDFIDIWQFNKKYFPVEHIKVLQTLLSMLSKGIRITYITGNHDETLRQYSDFSLDNFSIVDKLVLTLDNKKVWFFHGDVFDLSLKYSKWLAKLGGKGYDILILLNRGFNKILEKLGRDKYSLSKKVKDGVKTIVNFVNDFENTVSSVAIENEYDYVVCGHIHQPVIKEVVTPEGKVNYLNSGDWVENLSALEYVDGKWKIYYHESSI